MDISGNIENIVFASMFLSLVKKTALHFLVSVLRTGRSTKESLNHLIHRACLRKSQETLQILVFILIVLSYSTKLKIFHTFCLLHCPSLSTFKEKLGETANINIRSYNFKFSEKNCFILLIYCTVLYTGCPQKNLR